MHCGLVQRFGRSLVTCGKCSGDLSATGNPQAAAPPDGPMASIDAVSAAKATAAQQGGVFRDERNPKAGGTYKPFYTVTGSRSFFSNNGVKASDVKQGALGDCWLLGVAATIAEMAPGLIDTIFPQKMCGADSIIPLRLWFSGRWETLVVDADLPYSDGKLMYAHGSTWIALLEKAIAKRCGSYAALSAGSPTEAFVMLTGMATSSFNSDEKHSGVPQWTCEGLWQALDVRLKAGKLIAATCRENQMGLAQDHVFSVISLNGHGADGTIKLRNPWGNFTELTGIVGGCSNDGVFSINMADFARCFTDVYVCDVAGQSTVAVTTGIVPESPRYIPGDDELGGMLYRVTSPCDVTIMCSQAGLREGFTAYCDMAICVVRIEIGSSLFDRIFRRPAEGFQFTKVEEAIIHPSVVSQTTVASQRLEEGIYAIFPLSFQCQRAGLSSGLTLSVYGDGACVRSTTVPGVLRIVPGHVVCKAVIHDKGTERTPLKESTLYELRSGNCCISVVEFKKGLFSGGKTAKVVAEITQAEGMHLIPKGRKVTTDIPSDACCVVGIAVPEQHRGKYSLRFHQTVEVGIAETRTLVSTSAFQDIRNCVPRSIVL